MFTICSKESQINFDYDKYKKNQLPIFELELGKNKVKITTNIKDGSTIIYNIESDSKDYVLKKLYSKNPEETQIEFISKSFRFHVYLEESNQRKIDNNKSFDYYYQVRMSFHYSSRISQVEGIENYIMNENEIICFVEKEKVSIIDFFDLLYSNWVNKF